MLSCRRYAAHLALARWLAPVVYSDGARSHVRAPSRLFSGSNHQVAIYPRCRCFQVNTRAVSDWRRVQANKVVTGAKKTGWIKPPPEIVRSDILKISLFKQKQLLREKPGTFTFEALDRGNNSNAPVCNWSTRQREWLVECLNTIFENSVVCFTLYVRPHGAS